MRILDSNLVIYAAKTEFSFLRPLILDKASCVSIITKLEALGYRNLTNDDKAYLEGVFKTTTVLAIDDTVIDQAILLRQARKMSVGDAIIAATALLNDFDLYTNNADDFSHISDLTVINPFISK
ncbi:type II toxin-antitoxin system VapC family toxin [Fibrisoma montanum]|uniref:Type II toxin-antitoxin system VapC family toxin n=1 Tax=Fibrisoma montanum TaxID=2305895 RepID=A0A418MEF9_9BACT|nr:type II toxin-antitoxin system VapC family toxin [Fibrisoma montanum]RIV25192.1 type II toxin-antitoxin system VapC family toxin [Fibrisoma montanum]